MSVFRETVLVVVFDAVAQANTLRRLCQLLEIQPEPNWRWRRHGLKLVTFRLDGFDDQLIEPIKSLPGVSKVVHLPGSSRLYSRQDGKVRQAVRVTPDLCFGDGGDNVIAGR